MSSPEVGEHEQRVNQAIAGYLEAIEAGRAPAADQFLVQHPDLVVELKAFLADFEQFQQLARPVAPPPRKSAVGCATSATMSCCTRLLGVAWESSTRRDRPV